MKKGENFTLKKDSSHDDLGEAAHAGKTDIEKNNLKQHNTRLLGSPVESRLVKGFKHAAGEDEVEKDIMNHGLFKTHRLCRHIGGPLDTKRGQGGGHNAVLSLSTGSIIGEIGTYWASRINGSSSFIQGIRYSDSSSLPDVGRMPVQFSMLPGTRSEPVYTADGKEKKDSGVSGGGVSKWNYGFSLGKNGYPLRYANAMVGVDMDNQHTSFDEIDLTIPQLGRQGPSPKPVNEYVWIYLEEEPGITIRKSHYHGGGQNRSASGAWGIATSFPVFPITIYDNDKLSIDNYNVIKAITSLKPPEFVEIKCPEKWVQDEWLTIVAEVKGAENVVSPSGEIQQDAYQWQYWNEGAWQNIDEGNALYKGSKTKSLEINMVVGWQGNNPIEEPPLTKYRCMAANEMGIVRSDEIPIRGGVWPNGICDLKEANTNSKNPESVPEITNAPNAISLILKGDKLKIETDSGSSAQEQWTLRAKSKEEFGDVRWEVEIGPAAAKADETNASIEIDEGAGNEDESVATLLINTGHGGMSGINKLDKDQPPEVVTIKASNDRASSSIDIPVSVT